VHVHGFTKERRGETHVRETFSAVADRGEMHLSLAYEQGGDLVIWSTAEEPNLALRAAADPRVVRWYQEDQVRNVVRSDPLNVSRLSELSVNVKGELEDVFDGNERVVAVVIQRPYMRQVYVPEGAALRASPSGVTTRRRLGRKRGPDLASRRDARSDPGLRPSPSREGSDRP
jgi:hypothetical protein